MFWWLDEPLCCNGAKLWFWFWCCWYLFVVDMVYRVQLILHNRFHSHRQVMLSDKGKQQHSMDHTAIAFRCVSASVCCTVQLIMPFILFWLGILKSFFNSIVDCLIFLSIVMMSQWQHNLQWCYIAVCIVHIMTCLGTASEIWHICMLRQQHILIIWPFMQIKSWTRVDYHLKSLVLTLIALMLSVSDTIGI